ncbi:NnrU family protein [Candidatus Cyanaurora vandensis]|uniref:NnrU family protein n=1 Tax=Candidatus Cyanaurora vandensis TaxID=2714958 RepID=UPI00257FB80A|nr:NnrU family protein [Candidatus Cyanaurora vandensis]
MGAVAVIGGLWLAFAASHTLLSSVGLRANLQKKLGAGGYLGFYSLVAAATFIPLVVYYGSHKHEGPLLWADGPRSLTYSLMVLAVFFIAASLISPPPGSMQSRGSLAVTGITKLTRHPGFIGFILFGLAHLIVNGYASDVAFWGGLVLYTPFGAWHQDQRKRQENPVGYGQVLTQTSFIPGLAILQGRQSFKFADLGFIPLIATVFGVILLIQGHPYFAGVSLIQR